MKRASLVLLVAVTLAACQKTDSDSIAFVNVSASSGLVGITQLQATVTLSTLGSPTTEYFPQTNAGVEITFPTSFSLTMPRSREGTLTVAIKAVNAWGIPVSFGQDSKPVVVGKQTSFSILLEASGTSPDAGTTPDVATPDAFSRDSGAGGSTTSTGGVTATGGVIGASGVTATGGVVTTGGVIPVGGSGGTIGMGGTTGKGSTTATGGATSSGVTTGSGGTTGKGGTTTTATGGTGGSTNSSTGNTGTTVTFSAGKGQGAMTGDAFVSCGTADIITSPTCGTGRAAITPANPCPSDTNWSAPDRLCISGVIPARSTSNGGLQIGLNSTKPAGGGLGQSFFSVTIGVSGAPTAPLRVTIHALGGDTHCANWTDSTSAIAFNSFTKTCQDPEHPGTTFPFSDVSMIDQITVMVPSANTWVTVTDLCITKIEFTK
jgi:hypothetical protein